MKKLLRNIGAVMGIGGIIGGGILGVILLVALSALPTIIIIIAIVWAVRQFIN